MSKRYRRSSVSVDVAIDEFDNDTLISPAQTAEDTQ